uniref:Uncharacterized protein n=1 Tax=Peronospora matthiolae TaxID=2874970 RepID=A0AAV1UFR2_9STRA
MNEEGNNPFVAISGQITAVAAVGRRSNALRDIGDYQLKLVYSGEPDGDTDSRKSAPKKESEVFKAE